MNVNIFFHISLIYFHNFKLLLKIDFLTHLNIFSIIKTLTTMGQTTLII